MKSRIPRIWFSLAVAIPIGYGTALSLDTELLGKFTSVALFYANVPARLCDAVTNLKRLPERMNPTRSECNEP